jgi:hypothetical protein
MSGRITNQLVHVIQYLFMPRVLTLLLIAFVLASSLDAAEHCAGYSLIGAPLKSAPFGIVADVNGDGIPDVVSGGSVTFGGSNTVVKLPRTVNTGPVVAVARVSRKGPVALRRFSGTSLESLRVSPDGTTTVSSTSLSGLSDSTTILGVGDFNEDGIDDIVLRQQIRFGSASGTFTPGPALPLAIPPGLEVNGLSVDVGVGDFDGDHHLDLAIRPRFSYSTSPPWVYPPLTIYSGDGKGNFHATRQVPNRQYDEIIMPIYVADLDGDGVDDLILDAWYGIDLVPSHPGTERQALADSGIYIDSITVGDFNGDGRPDLAAFAQSSSTGDAQIDLRVFLNDGHGGMRLAWKTRLRSAQMSARDVDGDGKDDLVLGPYYPPGNFIENESMAAVLHSNGDGSFSGLPMIDSPPTYGGVQGDFDGNGADDVMLSTYVRISNTQIDYKTIVFWNEGNGSFHTTTTTQQLLGRELAADVDGDGRAEILQPSGKNEISVYKVAPDGTLQGVSRIAGDPQDSMLGYAVGHFTSGNQEIALVETTSVSSQLKVEIFDVRSPLVPRLTATVTAALPLSDGSDLVASDLNGDGRDDLIILGEGIEDCPDCFEPNADGYVMALLSTSTSFSPATMLYQSEAALVRPIAGDFDGDEIGDFAFIDGEETKVFFGDRAGHYRQASPGTLSYSSYGPLLAVADLDGDGADDILTSDGSTLSLLFGGLTAFARRESYAVTGTTEGLFAPRPHPGGAPQVFVTSDDPGALLFSPTCGKSRAVRH